MEDRLHIIFSETFCARKRHSTMIISWLDSYETRRSRKSSRRIIERCSVCRMRRIMFPIVYCLHRLNVANDVIDRIVIKIYDLISHSSIRSFILPLLLLRSLPRIRPLLSPSFDFVVLCHIRNMFQYRNDR